MQHLLYIRRHLFDLCKTNALVSSFWIVLPWKMEFDARLNCFVHFISRHTLWYCRFIPLHQYKVILVDSMFSYTPDKIIASLRSRRCEGKT